MKPIEHVLKQTDLATQPITYTIAGLSFYGMSLSDWLLVVGLLTGIFNLFFIGIRLTDVVTESLIPTVRKCIKLCKELRANDKTQPPP